MKKTLNQMIVFLTILCAFIAGILFFEAIKGVELHYSTVIGIVVLIFCWPTTYWLTYHKGRYDERNRQRDRITNIIKKYE